MLTQRKCGEVWIRAVPKLLSNSGMIKITHKKSRLIGAAFLILCLSYIPLRSALETASFLAL